MGQLTTYGYDAVGNRISKNEDGILTSYNYDAGNQLLSEERSGYSIVYSYDKNGNLVKEDAGGSVTTYAWNEENFLKDIAAPGGSESYEYSSGLRRKKVVSGEATGFVWDGMNLLQETNTFSGTKAHYTDSPGIWGGLTSQRSAGSSQFFGFDMQGNTRLLAGENGGVNERHDYSAFGEQASTLPAGSTSFLFGGKVGYYSDARQRLYVRARHYAPSQGRWMSKDPIGFAGLDWNLYRYVDNNPHNGADPSGLFVKHRNEVGDIRKGLYMYTCKCGWIDRNHFNDASNGVTNSFNFLRYLQFKALGDQLPPDYYNASAWEIISRAETGSNFVKSAVFFHISPGAFLNRSLPITAYQRLAELLTYGALWQVEVLQDWGAIIGKGGQSNWSYEDLISDWLGTMAVYQSGIRGDIKQRQDFILRKCGIVNENRAKLIFDAMGTEKGEEDLQVKVPFPNNPLAYRKLFHLRYQWTKCHCPAQVPVPKIGPPQMLAPRELGPVWYFFSQPRDLYPSFRFEI